MPPESRQVNPGNILGTGYKKDTFLWRLSKIKRNKNEDWK